MAVLGHWAGGRGLTPQRVCPSVCPGQADPTCFWDKKPSRVSISLPLIQHPRSESLILALQLCRKEFECDGTQPPAVVTSGSFWSQHALTPSPVRWGETRLPGPVRGCGQGLAALEEGELKPRAAR